MESSLYRLRIRPHPGADFDPDPERLRARLLRIPGVSQTADGRFEFGDRDEHGVTEIECLSGGEIEFRVPRPWVMPRGPQIFALVFMTAEWCSGEVYDPQIDDTLRKDVVLQGLVAVRQAQREGETPAPPDPDTPSEAPPAPRRPWWKRG